MKEFLTGLLIIIICFNSHSQDKTALKFSKTITETDLKSYLSVLASDSLEGRETGERGQKIAAKYIANKFREFGLEGPVKTVDGSSYIQKYPLKRLSYRTAYLKRGEEKKNNYQDFLYYSRSETMGEEIIEVVYLGDASLDKLQNRNLSGKYVAVISEKLEDWRNLFAGLENLNTAGVILIVEDESRYSFIMNRFASYLKTPKMSLTEVEATSKILITNPSLASWIYDIPYSQLKNERPGLKSKLIFNADLLVEELEVENVLGFIQGENKPEEVLVISSHYDHIGVEDDGRINNGADDDGSGTSALIELAETFAEAANNGQKPTRSILFLAFSGEEKGLLGSKYYTKNPVFPMENTVTNLNIDMIGRIDSKHQYNPEYVYLIGADRLSQELHDLSEKINKARSGLTLDYTYNDANDPNRYYYRSDHYNFAEKGVPVIFYYSGTHEDYHQPTDTIEKIRFDLLEKRTSLIFFTAWELAYRSDRVKLNAQMTK